MIVTTTDVVLTTGVAGVGLGAIAGTVFATKDEHGNEQFNWGAALIAGLLTAVFVRPSL